MKYEQYLESRRNTFKKTFELLKDRPEICIVELGTSRSFKSWGISSNIEDWHPNNPEMWAWSDGCFTKLFADNLKDKKLTIWTIDPCSQAIKVVKKMVGDNQDVQILQTTSTDFLREFDGKIDLLYMDHLESGETACKVHLQDSEIIIQRELMKDDGIILIDDCPKGGVGKGKLSIPYLLQNGYKTILHEYQMILIK
tara:strand:+ start:1346 stop:1936 length:591 start_codon:yes stop_codon:yes gene_type:complete